MTERKLQFIDGSSSKFWHAKVEALTLSVVFGRLGTNGQTQDKTFTTAEEATKAFDKLVAEKLKKGYADANGATLAPTPSPPPKPKPKAEPRPVSEAPAAVEASASATGMTEKPDAPPAAPVVTVVEAPVARIRLTDADRKRALVGGVAAPLPRPPIEPFDRAATIAKIARVGKRDTYAYSIQWDRLDVSIAMSREEALIHFYAIRGRMNTLGAILDGIAAMEVVEPSPDLSGIRARARPLAVVVYRAFGLDTTIELLMQKKNNWYGESWFEGFECDVLPYLDVAERSAVSAAFHAKLAALADSRDVVRMLGYLGEDAATIRASIACWPAGSGKLPIYEHADNGNSSLRALFALSDPDEIAREAARLEANPIDSDEVRMLLAATGTRTLDLIVATIIGCGTKASAEALAKALALVEAPEAALPMLRLMLESRAPGVGRAWLDEHPAFGTAGLISLVGTAGAKGDAVTAYFRSLSKRGLGAHVEAALATLPDGHAAVVRGRITDSIESEHPIASDGELPEWATRCFGDPANLTAPPIELPPEVRNPVVRVEGEAATAKLAAGASLPAPEALGPAAPFDLEASIATLASGLTSVTYGASTYHSWKLHSVRPALPMSREAAHFWFSALPIVRANCSLGTFDTQIRAQRLDGDVPFPSGAGKGSPVTVAYTLWGLEGIARYVTSFHGCAALVTDAVDQVVRFLSTGDRDALRPLLFARGEPTIGELLLAKRLGATRAELAPHLGAFTKSKSNCAAEFLEIVTVFEDAWEIAKLGERYALRPKDFATANRWLALTGVFGADVLKSAVLDAYSDKLAIAKVLARVQRPDVAPVMLALRKSPATKEIARQWFEANPVFTIDGLLPLVGSKDKQAAAALDLLRDMRRRGYGPIIAERSKGDANVAKVVLDPLAGLSKPTRADEALVASLPQIAIRCDAGARRLAPAQVATILAELRSSSLGAPTQRLVLLRESADRHVLDAFVWALFQGWLSDGAPTKERWKLEAVGHLGGDASAMRLAALVRTWPGESQHQRAVLGLDCLRAIGSDTALMQIHAIAQRVSFKGIKERAGECLDGIAQDRGFTREELADRIIPDGGLDERGTRVFDFGPRAFTFQLGTDLKAIVRDASGKKLSDLPKPGAKDDAALAAESVAAWKVLKKQVADVAKTQAARLESAMVVGRRWTVEEFDTLFRTHPLMVHLVRRLIWSAYDAEGKAVQSFRLADDDTLADAEDAECVLPSSTHAVGIVHPSHLSEGERGTWGERLADYDIIAPFQQLGRPTLGLNDDEKGASTLRRFGGHDVDAKVLVFGLEALGWTRGRPEDAGSFATHHKTYGAITAVVTYADGCWVGTNGDDWPRQRIEALGFVRDARGAESGFFGFGHETENTLRLADVDALILSEALYDVTRLYERGAPQA